ncbi:MAG TPA: hypothetical protein VIK18_19830 [Pirellulales bacterium]
MNTISMTKVSASTAAEICRGVALGAEATARLKERQTAGEFLAVLAQAGLHADACRFLAHALPKREAVCWACLCLRQSGIPLAPKAAAALEAAETWVREATDETRRAAFPAAEAAEFGTPAGCAALAAFLSGGSLAPAHLPAVPPKEHLTATAVIGSLTLAAVSLDPARAPEQYRKFLGIGLEIARGERPCGVNPPQFAARVS